MREAFQSAASSVQSMLSPVVPQADDPGTSPELNAADPAVSLQAHPESPPLQVHPGDVTVVMELVESLANILRLRTPTLANILRLRTPTLETVECRWMVMVGGGGIGG